MYMQKPHETERTKSAKHTPPQSFMVSPPLSTPLLPCRVSVVCQSIEKPLPAPPLLFSSKALTSLCSSLSLSLYYFFSFSPCLYQYFSPLSLLHPCLYLPLTIPLCFCPSFVHPFALILPHFLILSLYLSLPLSLSLYQRASRPSSIHLLQLL